MYDIHSKLKKNNIYIIELLQIALQFPGNDS